MTQQVYREMSKMSNLHFYQKLYVDINNKISVLTNDDLSEEQINKLDSVTQQLVYDLLKVLYTVEDIIHNQ